MIRRNLGICIVLLFILFVSSTYTLTANEFEYHLRKFYFIDYAEVALTTENTTASFDIPINFSAAGYEQYVRIVNIGGNAYLNRTNGISVDVSIFNGSIGYVVALIEINYSDLSLEVVQSVINNSNAYDWNLSDVPEDIMRDYIGDVHPLIYDEVKPSFEDWLSELGYTISNTSRTFIAVAASIFIYGEHFIKYNASPLPRTFEEVIESREGDCDDMSRVLMNLLWSYGIPSRMEYGYVFLDYYDVMNIGKSYIIFKDAGPHGWLTAYIPDVGWVSLDLLAGARLERLAVVTGTTTYYNVSGSDVEDIEEFNTKVRYAEYVSLTPAENLRLSDYLDSILNTSKNEIRPLLSEILIDAGLLEPSTTSSSYTTTTEGTQISNNQSPTQSTNSSTDYVNNELDPLIWIIFALALFALAVVVYSVLRKILRIRGVSAVVRPSFN